MQDILWSLRSTDVTLRAAAFLCRSHPIKHSKMQPRPKSNRILLMHVNII